MNQGWFLIIYYMIYNQNQWVSISQESDNGYNCIALLEDGAISNFKSSRALL